MNKHEHEAVPAEVEMWSAEPEPKKSTAPRIIGLCAAVAILLGAAGAGLYFWMNSGPQAAATRALTKTENAIAAQLEALGKTLGGDVLAKLADRPSKMDLHVDLSKTIADSSGADADDSLWFNLEGAVSPKDELAHIKLTSGMGLEGAFFAEKDKVTVDAPDLLPNPIFFTMEGLMKLMNEGLLSGTPGIDPDLPDFNDPDFDWDNFDWDDYMEDTSAGGPGLTMAPAGTMLNFGALGGLLLGSDFDELVEKLEAAYDKLRESGEYVEADRKAPEGFSEEMKVIEITYPTEAVDVFFNECLEILIGALEEMVETLGIAETFGDIREHIFSSKGSEIAQTVYIDRRGCARVVELSVLGSIAEVGYGDNTKMDITLRTGEGADPLGDLAIIVKSKSDSTAAQTITLTGRGGFDRQNGLDYNVRMVTVTEREGLDEPDESVMEFGVQYNPNADGDNLTLTGKDKDVWRTSDFALTGRLETGRNSFTLSLSNAKGSVTSDNEYVEDSSGDVPLDISLNVELTKDYAVFFAPDGAKDGAEITSGEWMEIFMALMAKFQP